MMESRVAKNIYEVSTLESYLQGNPYAGRGILLGTSEDGTQAVAAYFIMGRSQNSRNRIFVKENDSLRTDPFDASKVEDPSLIIYNALRVTDHELIVTNGDQTDTVFDGITSGKTFQEALESRAFEPDAPNFTPRISGLLSFQPNGDFHYELSILKSIDAEGSDTCRYTFSYPAKPGLGHFIHTYLCDGNPLPSFTGEPVRVQISSDIDVLTNTLWNALNEENKISLYVRYTNPITKSYTDRLINKNN